MPNLVGGVMTSVLYCLYRNSEVLRETFNTTGTGELAIRCMRVDVLKCTSMHVFLCLPSILAVLQRIEELSRHYAIPVVLVDSLR